MNALSSLVLGVLGVCQVDAHGILTQPAATFRDNYFNTSYTARTDFNIDWAFGGKKWDNDSLTNQETFAASFPTSRFRTLRDMLDLVEPTCGNTVLTGQRVDVSWLHSMKWQNDEFHEGFIASHYGPCEAWIDNTRVFSSDCCCRDFPAYPAEIPIDFSSCRGDCTFTFYWLALHEPLWQVYKQCTPIHRTAYESAVYTSAATAHVIDSVSTTEAAVVEDDSAPGVVDEGV